MNLPSLPVRSLLLPLAVVFLAGSAVAQTAVPASGPPPTSEYFEFVPLADGVYAAYAASGLVTANAGVVDLGGGEALVFDASHAPAAAADLARFGEWLSGGRVRYLVNSHWHYDHVGGNQAFDPDVVVVGTDATRAAIAPFFDRVLGDTTSSQLSVERSHARYDSLRAAETDPERRQEWAYMANTYGNAAERVYAALAPRLPTLTFERSLTIHGPERAVELHAYDGHSASDVVLYVPDDSVAFVGDLLFIGRHTPLYRADTERLLATHRAVLERGVRTVVPGHGPVGTHEDLERFPAYVEAVEAEARALFEAGRPVEDAATVVMPPPYDALWWREMFLAPSVRAFYERLGAADEEGADEEGAR